MIGAIITIGVDYLCGCKERWAVSHIPEDEPALITLPECHPSRCFNCEDSRATERGFFCPNGREPGPPALEEVVRR
jgi:hypothetical protein